MDENETIDDVLEELEEVEEDTTDDTDWKALALKNQGIAKRLQTKLAKASEKKEEPAPAKETKTEFQTGKLDETQLDYLDLKGISDQDEIDIIERIVAKTGQTVRQALKDDYVVAKLESLRAEKEVKDATPSSTKRSGSGTGDNLATALAKFNKDGTLPDDYTLRTAVVNALEKQSSGNAPSWH